MVRFSRAISLSLLVPTTVFATTDGLDMASAKRMAVSNNHGLAAIRHEYTEIGSKADQLGSAFRPTLGVVGGIEATRSSPEKGYGFTYLSGSYNLFNGYRDEINTEIVKNDAEEVKQRLRASEFLVELDVEEHFQTYLVKDAIIQVKKEALARNEDHRNLVRISRHKGLLSNTDVMEFEIQEAKLQSDLLALNQELSDARGNLKTLLGSGINDGFAILGNVDHVHIDESLDEIAKSLETTNLTIKRQSLALESAKLERKVSENKWLPTVDLEVQAGFLQPSEREVNNRLDTNVLLSAKMDLYDGGLRRSKIGEKSAKNMRLEAELTNQKVNVLRAIENGYRGLKVIEMRLDLEKNNAKLAEKYYNSVLSEYKRGAKNSQDLNGAAEKLSDAREREYELEYNFMKLKIETERELGRYLKVRKA